MNELPVNILLKVLDFLPTVEAILCRAVCKSWLALIDQSVLDELNLFYDQRQHTMYFQFRKCFLDPKRSISFDHPCSFYNLVIGNEQFGYLFRNLKKFAFEQCFERWPENYEKLEKLTSMCVIRRTCKFRVWAKIKREFTF